MTDKEIKKWLDGAMSAVPTPTTKELADWIYVNEEFLENGEDDPDYGSWIMAAFRLAIMVRMGLS